jgi:transposase InsO family protein
MPQEFTRFERADCNELWQSDFKRIGRRRVSRETVTLLDDASRFCLAVAPVIDQTLTSWWEVFWEACGAYGPPEAVLTDNGPAFRNNATWRWSSMDLRLALLGIRSLHGRPYHPQTQGKVERLHGTLEREHPNSEPTQQTLESFRTRYNWERPHEALDMKTPGTRYVPSPRKRPDKLPEPFFPKGTVTRVPDMNGVFSYKGKRYKAGKAFAQGPIGICADANGELFLAWADSLLCPLNDILVR